MKKLLIGLGLVLASTIADANVYWNGYAWLGNVCRTGYYYTIVPYQYVGNTCWNAGWNTYGVITDE